jgi:hypothetical protein
MENIERQVWREARAMTRREVIIKAISGQLGWVAAADIIGITPRQMRRLRRAIERSGMSAAMDQRGGRTRRKRIATIAMLCRLKREVYPDFSLRHFYEQVSEKASGQSLIQLAAANVAGSRSSGKSACPRQLPAPREAPRVRPPAIGAR